MNLKMKTKHVTKTNDREQGLRVYIGNKAEWYDVSTGQLTYGGNGVAERSTTTKAEYCKYLHTALLQFWIETFLGPFSFLNENGFH